MNNGDNRMKTLSGQTTLPPKDVENLAIEALTLIAADPALASRFMSLSGFDAGSLRMASKRPHFLAGVLDYVMTDERLLLDLAAATGHRPEAIAAACRSLENPAPGSSGLRPSSGRRSAGPL